MMENKFFEPNESYNRKIEELLEFIKMRDDLARLIKTAPPERKREGQIVLAEMDAKIEDAEYLLDVQCQTQELLNRALEAQNVLLERLTDRAELIFIHGKRSMPPDKFKEFENFVTGDFTPDEREQFYARIAAREAEQPLDEIAAQSINDEKHSD